MAEGETKTVRRIDLSLEPAITYKSRAVHSEAPIVRGTGYDVEHLDQRSVAL
jgi:hypothetical protein